MNDIVTPAPGFGALIKIGSQGDWDGVPDSPNPFYFGAQDGLYLHRRNLLGRGIVREMTWPTSFAKFGHPNGSFQFEADPIPANLMGQVVNFFERIYDRQHTEAAVLLTMHEKTKEWRIFVPTQLVSHGGVNYVFNPTTIQRPWVLVGSIHSHCDFGAGHSSTDTGDIDGFDGLHCTIGMIKRETPQIVAMATMNKSMFHYKEQDFGFLFDFSEAKKHEAPAWWDRYVENTRTKTKPVGFELYEKFKKTTVVKEEKKSGQSVVRQIGPGSGYQSPVRFNANDWSYSEKARRMVHKDWHVADDGTISYPNGGKMREVSSSGITQVERLQPGRGSEDAFADLSPAERRFYINFLMQDDDDVIPVKSYGWSPEDYRRYGYTWDTDTRSWKYTGSSQPLRESDEFNARQAAQRGAIWNDDGSLKMRRDTGPTYSSMDTITRKEAEDFGLIEKDDPFWEDHIDPKVRDALFDSDLLLDEDIDWAIQNPQAAADAEQWVAIFYRKVLNGIEVLQRLGINARLDLRAAKPPADIELIIVDDKPNNQTQHGVH